MMERDRGQGEDGQGIVEFALVAGFLLLILFGIVDFSRLFFAYATMSHGVREGARYGIIHPDDVAGIEQGGDVLQGRVRPSRTHLIRLCMG